MIGQGPQFSVHSDRSTRLFGLTPEGALPIKRAIPARKGGVRFPKAQAQGNVWGNVPSGKGGGL